MRTAFVILIVASLAVSGSMADAQTAGHQAHVLATPTEIKWVDGPPSLPGVKQAVLEGNPREAGPFTLRFMMPAGLKVPPHWHPGIEHVTVLSGTFNIGMGEKFDTEKLKAMPQGSFVVMPPHTPHFVQIKEETTIQLHGMGPWGLTWVNPDDDPAKKK